MSVNVSKFAKKKENSSSVTVNNSSRGYSNTNNNYTASQLDRMLWNIHDTGQDINGSLEIPQLSVNGRINATGIIHSNSEVSGPIGRFSYIYDCTEGHIDNLYSDHIDTQTLEVHETAKIKNLDSDRITTKYLDVTKSAHFAELVIDKIKSVGGSAVFSPADGFKIASEDDIIYLYNKNKVATGYCMLCWDAEDDRGATVNMWERGDQALCQNFNEATTGTSHNISNTYFWMYVFTAGTYDPQNPADIMYDHGSSEAYINQSSYKQETAYNSEGEKITFDNLKHYIVVYNNSSKFTDGENNEIDVRSGIFNPKPGNEVVMLGHRARLDEMQNDNNGVPEYKKRQSAIYIAAYNSTIEPNLMAPLIAQYQGVNNFDLSSHRTTHFAAGHNDIFGYDNVIRGSFKTINGTDIADLTGVTYFIKTDKAYVPVTSDYSLDSSFNIKIDCMYISGDSGPLYVGNKNSNMRLIVRYSRGNTSKSKVVYDTEIKNTYTLNLGQIIAPSTVLSGKIDSLSFEIAEYVNATVGYNTLYQYNMPVIQQPDNISYTNTELSKLNPMIELAQVDVEGNFALYLQYQVQYIIGNTVTNVDDTNYSVQFVIWDEDNNREHTKTIPYNSTKGCFEYNKSTQDNYEKTNVFGTYGGRSLLHDQYIEVSLIKNNGSIVLDKRIIPITLVAGAMFSVTDSITARVTSSESTLTDHTSRIGQLELDSEHFASDIQEINTTISEQGDSIESLEQNTSYIHQYADRISTRVENTRTEFNNAYTYITSNYSTIQQTNDQISLYVNSEVTDQMTGITETLKRTGIDITSYNITLNGDTIVNGTLDLNSGEGFNLNNEDGSLGAKIHGGEIPNISDWKSSNSSTTSLVRTYTDQKYFENTETSQEFTLNYNKFDLGYHQPLDQITINEIIITSNFPISGSGTFNITDGTDILATRNISSLTLVSSGVYYRYRVTLNWTYTSNVSARQLYGGYELNLTGTPRINTNNFSFRLNYTVTANKLIEIGSNGLATRVDTDDYMYMGESAFEVRHGNNGLQVYNSDGHIPASGQYGYGVKRYYNDISQNGWFPILTPSLYVLSGSSFLWNNYSYDMVITNYNSSSADVTIYLPTDRWRGRVCYIRKAGVSNIIVYTSGSDYMYLSQASGRTNVSNLTIQNGDMYMFVYTGQGTETVGRWVVNRIPNP